VGGRAELSRQQEEDEVRKAAAKRAVGEKREHLGPEPAADAGCSRIAVRLPDGRRLPPRRFRAGDTVASLYLHVDVALAELALAAGAPDPCAVWGSYDLHSSRPARALPKVPNRGPPGFLRFNILPSNLHATAPTTPASARAAAHLCHPPPPSPRHLRRQFGLSRPETPNWLLANSGK
jgi:hypothetical protein